MAVKDTEQDMRALMDANGWTFPVMIDGSRVASAYGVRTIPATRIIDSEGRVAERVVGGMTAAELSLLVDGLTR